VCLCISVVVWLPHVNKVDDDDDDDGRINFNVAYSPKTARAGNS